MDPWLWQRDQLVHWLADLYRPNRIKLTTANVQWERLRLAGYHGGADFMQREVGRTMRVLNVQKEQYISFIGAMQVLRRRSPIFNVNYAHLIHVILIVVLTSCEFRSGRKPLRRQGNVVPLRRRGMAESHLAAAVFATPTHLRGSQWGRMVLKTRRGHLEPEGAILSRSGLRQWRSGFLLCFISLSLWTEFGIGCPGYSSMSDTLRGSSCASSSGPLRRALHIRRFLLCFTFDTFRPRARTHREVPLVLHLCSGPTSVTHPEVPLVLHFCSSPTSNAHPEVPLVLHLCLTQT